MMQLLNSSHTQDILYLLLLTFTVVAGILAAKRLEAAPLRISIHEESISSSAFRWNYLSLPTIALTTALILGGALRFYGVDFGLPTAYHPDELQKAHFIRRMTAEGRLNPNFNLQPPFLLYLSWIFEKLVDGLGFYQDNSITRFLFAGRLVNALCGTISIYLVYCIGKRISDNLSASLATLLFAFSPLHVTNSRYMKEDALYLVFVLACVLAVLKAIDNKKLPFLYLAGLLAGFAFGSKYTGLVSFCIVLGSGWLANEKFSFLPNIRIFAHSCLALLLMPVGFFITAPYLLTDWYNISLMLEGLGSESRHAMHGHMGLIIDPWSQLWMFHFRRSIVPGIQLIPTLLGLLGMGMALYRWRSKGLFLVALVVLFYLPAEWARSKPPPQPDRYVIACIPFLCLLAGEFFRELTRHSKVLQNVMFQGVAISFIALFPFARTLLLATEVRNDTRKQMTEWMALNLPQGAKVVMMGGSTYLPRMPGSIRGKNLRKVIGSDEARLVAALRESNYDYLITTDLNNGRFSTEIVNEKALRIKEANREIQENFTVAKQISARNGSYGFHNPTLTLYALHAEPSKN